MIPPLSSEGLQQVLARAAGDQSFREDLLARRGDAARDAGIALQPSERSILASVDRGQLELMIDELGKVAPRIPEEFAPVACGGIRPDLPGPERNDLTPLPPPAGIRPDLPISRGHSSKLPLILGGAVLVGGAIAVGTLTAGISPDLPPPRAPSAQPGTQPDAKPAPASQPAEPASDARAATKAPKR